MNSYLSKEPNPIRMMMIKLCMINFKRITTNGMYRSKSNSINLGFICHVKGNACNAWGKFSIAEKIVPKHMIFMLKCPRTLHAPFPALV